MDDKIPTSEEMWAMLARTEKLLEKTAEQSEKTERQMAETAKQMAETDKKFAKIHKELGGIGENNGLVAEEIVFHSLAKDMVFAGIKFDFIDHGTVRTRKFHDGKRVKGEYDVLLYNGTSVAIIEVKHRVGRDALKRLIEVQMPRFRQIFSEYKDCKMYLGLGGMSFEKDVAEEAQSLGIATLTLSGDAVEINDKDVKAW
jgi:type I site-specific restriction-modification system R (restriction) subunit